MNRPIPNHRSYWRRAHRDWRLWGMVVLMLTALVVYLIAADLRWALQTRPPPQPLTTPAGN